MAEHKPKFTAGELAQACGGRLVTGREELAADGLSTDTRTLAPGQVFLALIGPNHDAHAFIPQAIEAGARIIIAQRRDASWILPDDLTLILVDDTTKALTALAVWQRRRLRGRVIAITGSCGKSTVKTITGAILARAGRCSVARKSFNNRIGVSLSLLDADPADDYVVLEMGTNHPGEIDELARIAQPHVGVITCIGECHLEGLGDQKGVRDAKAELVPHLDPQGLLVLNADDKLCLSIAPLYKGLVRTFGFARNAYVRPHSMKRDGECMVFRVWGRQFRLSAVGRHNVLNAAAALCVARWAGVTPECAQDGLADVKLPELRWEKRTMGGVTYLLDTYNSNPTAMRAALEAFAEEPVARRRIVVCGDMLELGEASVPLHRRLGRVLGLMDIEALIAVGPLSKHVVEGWCEVAGDARKVIHLESADDAWQAVLSVAAPGDCVLIKGSRAMQLEKIAEAIAQKLGIKDREVAA
jgi:UDP-N-acetylmuramoyl-tripeptide--D-alanyl-D-alanine ligase